MADERDARGEPARVFERAGALVAGKYRIERMLGRGGMGVVMLATHTELQERVALKFLTPNAAERPTATLRFLREARTTARLRSVHTCRVFDAATLEDGTPYLVMEFLAGADLGAVLQSEGALPITVAVDYVVQACEALAEAHAMGIVHRDLKPANLFVSRYADGRPCIKVLDFGIAKAHEPRGVALTDPASTIGSPGYMAPEQLRGGSDVDPRTDIWALGATLFELIAGHPPFQGSPEAIAARVLLETAPGLRLSAVQPDAAGGLADVVARCLERDAADRYQNAGDLAMALAPFGSPHATLKANTALRVAHRSPDEPRALGAATATATATETRGGTAPATAVEQAEARDASPSPRGTRMRTRARTRSAWITAALLLLGLVGGVATLARRHASRATDSHETPVARAVEANAAPSAAAAAQAQAQAQPSDAVDHAPAAAPTDRANEVRGARKPRARSAPSLTDAGAPSASVRVDPSPPPPPHAVPPDDDPWGRR